MSTNPTPNIPEGHVFIGDLPAAVVFAALYNNAIVKGANKRTAFDRAITALEAEDIINIRDEDRVIDEHNGRIIGMDPKQFSFDPTIYDEANLAGQPIKAKDIIDNVRAMLNLAAQDFWPRLENMPSAEEMAELAFAEDARLSGFDSVAEYIDALRAKRDSLAGGNLMGDFVSPLGAAIAKARESIKPNRWDQAVANVERARIESAEEAFIDGHFKEGRTHKPSGSYPRNWDPH